MIESVKVTSEKVVDTEYVVKSTLEKKYANVEILAEIDVLTNKIQGINEQMSRINAKLARLTEEKAIYETKLAKYQGALVLLPPIPVVEEVTTELL